VVKFIKQSRRFLGGQSMVLPAKNEINQRVDSCVQRYQAGDQSALDDVYEHLVTFCLRVISKTCGKYVQTDDEEAGLIPHVILDVIEKYHPERGSFLVYLGRAVRNRTIDRARKAKHNPIISLSSLKHDQAPFLEKADTIYFENIIDDIARSQEIEKFEKLLTEFEISLGDLARISPRQAKTRIQAQQAAWLITQHPGLCSYLLEKKILPNKLLEDKYGINRQILDRYRKYIIAAALIIVHDFGYLKPYVTPVQKEEV
jgi:RNA polymerase sigma factor